MQRILVAVDGSTHSLKGVTEAARIAKSLGSQLELINVLPPILLAPSVYGEAIKKIEEGNRLAADEILSRAKAVDAEAGVTASTKIVTGSPAEALADLADSEHVWGVVIGAKGHGAVSRVLLGSITDRLVHICPRPVLVVR
jgi:nucleotide-binding universal stress UspA family protein